MSIRRHTQSVLILVVTGMGAIALAQSALGDDTQLRQESNSRFGIVKAVADTIVSAPDAQLGRALFWDVRLSADGKTACASCHRREDWGGDRRQFSPDAKGKLTSRNSQTVLNSMEQPSLRWRGDRKSGAQQAEGSLTGSMGLVTAEAVIPLLKELDYETLFREAFANETEPVSPANYGRALQAYQATLATPSPFDRFLSGDDTALDAEQKAGLNTFLKIGCADCHDGPLLGGGSYQKFGVVKDYWSATGAEDPDAGRFSVTKKESERYVFRVQMLRNVAKTAPYFHDGSVDSLSAAIQVMAEVQLGQRLPDSDAAAIVKFLDALTGQVPEQFAPPTTFPGREGPGR